MSLKVIVENGNFSKTQMIDIIKKYLLLSDIQLLDVLNKSNNFVQFDVFINDKIISLNMFLKNISNGGWKEKVDKKRIQVPAKNIRDLEMNTDIFCNMLVGFCIVNNKPLIAVRNPFRYMFHKTNRSCYTNVFDIATSYTKGFYSAKEAQKTVYYSDATHLKTLIEKYIEGNAI